MKKNFEQPKLMVVRMNSNDIITMSDGLHSTVGYGTFAPGREHDLNSWYEGY